LCYHSFSMSHVSPLQALWPLFALLPCCDLWPWFCYHQHPLIALFFPTSAPNYYVVNAYRNCGKFVSCGCQIANWKSKHLLIKCCTLFVSYKIFIINQILLGMKLNWTSDSFLFISKKKLIMHWDCGILVLMLCFESCSQGSVCNLAHHALYDFMYKERRNL
jgi:hypothetical protein